jgi:HK97 family phage major capsid protein
VARRYVNPNRRNGAAVADVEDAAGRQFSIPPGQVTTNDIRAYMAIHAPKKLGRPDAAPGARLDVFPWARSWGSYLSAIGQRDDATGAQAQIRRVMEDRPRDAMSERVPAEGGFLVPERLRQQVLAYMAGAAVRPRATVVPMDSLRVPIPVLDNPSQASAAQALGGLTFAWTEAGAGIAPTTADYGRLVLEAKKAAAYLQSVPNELVTDSPAFGDFLARVVGMGYGWFEDDQFIYAGTGVGEPQALVNAPGALAVTRNSGGNVQHVDIVTMVGALHAASKASATWLLGEDAFSQLLQLYEVAGAGAAADITPPQALKFSIEHGTWELLGLPAVVTDHQPAVGTAGDVMLADLSLYLIGDRQELIVERSARGAGFGTDTSNFRIKSRVDGRYWPQQTYTTTAGQTVSGLVVLH